MFGTLFSNLKAENANEPEITRRLYSRRQCDQAVCTINGTIYPVEDWSLGGTMLSGDTRLLSADEEVDIELKFKTNDGVLCVVQKAKVVRKTSQKIGLEFAPITKKTRTIFQTVIDDYVSNAFAGQRA